MCDCLKCRTIKELNNLIAKLDAEIERLKEDALNVDLLSDHLKARAEKAEAERNMAVELTKCECGTDDLCENLGRWADRTEKAEALLEDCKAGYRTAMLDVAELQNYRETFATIPHCLECQRWAINTELEHAPGCAKGTE